MPKLDSAVNRAIKTLDNFRPGGDAGLIPDDAFDSAVGVAIVHVIKAGVLYAGAKGGKGIVVKKLKNGWSAPCFLYIAGLSGGLLVGLEMTDFVFILRTKMALESFYKGNLQLGGNVSLALGPVGRTAEVSATTKGAAIWAYSKSVGIYGGVSIEGGGLHVDSKGNQKIYGRGASAADILDGNIPYPQAARPLSFLLDMYSHRRYENNAPQNSDNRNSFNPPIFVASNVESSKDSGLSTANSSNEPAHSLFGLNAADPYANPPTQHPLYASQNTLDPNLGSSTYPGQPGLYLSYPYSAPAQSFDPPSYFTVHSAQQTHPYQQQPMQPTQPVQPYSNDQTITKQ